MPVEDEYANTAEGKWKNKAGRGLAAAFLRVPLYLASVKNMESLSIMHSSQSREGGIKEGEIRLQSDRIWHSKETRCKAVHRAAKKYGLDIPELSGDFA